MSADYVAICEHCKMKIHAGYDTMGGAAIWGYAREDAEPVAKWIFDHSYHGAVKIMPEVMLKDNELYPETLIVNDE